MALSDTARRILAVAAQHPLHLAAPPEKLPIAATRAVLASLLKQGLVETCTAPVEQASLRWSQPDGTSMAARITDAGLAAIGSTAGAAAVTPSSAPLAPPQAVDGPNVPTDAEAAQPPSTAALARPSLRDAAYWVLAAWAAPEQRELADAMATLRSALPARTSRPPRQPGAPRQPRQATKQEAVLALLRRPEGATVAQITEITSWQAHTVRGFFAGLKKRQSIAVEAAERIRQVGPEKQGAKGSYTIYRVAEAG